MSPNSPDLKSTSSSSRRNRNQKSIAVPSGGAPSSYHHYNSSSSSSRMMSSSSSSDNLDFFWNYLSRLVDFQQMDIQSALDQMLTLISQPLNPQKVYKMSYYRKQTKNHWYRDDPAFLFVQILLLIVSSIAYCVAFRIDSLFSSSINFILENVIVNWFFTGVIISSVSRAIANQYLISSSNMNTSSSNSSSSAQIIKSQKVEWLYAFDIHCNAFFPFFVLVYGVQFFLLPIILRSNIFALILSNTLYAVAFSWYFYVTHLGYRSLPFLQNTEYFLFPIVLVIAVYVLNFIGYPFGLGWNASRLMTFIYFD